MAEHSPLEDSHCPSLLRVYPVSALHQPALKHLPWGVLLQQPFVKIKTVTPELLGWVFSSEGVYLYWINIPEVDR